uniref:Uncharacterized protein n=1 Tax=Anguilla anguilla TaxID=7936 RepID=A0A0E9SAI3_ANGAN
MLLRSFRRKKTQTILATTFPSEVQIIKKLFKFSLSPNNQNKARKSNLRRLCVNSVHKCYGTPFC